MLRLGVSLLHLIWHRKELLVLELKQLRVTIRSSVIFNTSVLNYDSFGLKDLYAHFRTISVGLKVAWLYRRQPRISLRIVNVGLTRLGQGLILPKKAIGLDFFCLLFSKADFSVRLTTHLNLIDCLINQSSMQINQIIQNKLKTSGSTEEVMS